MAYEKRVCVVHQIKKGFAADGGDLSGAVYAERLGSELTITPRLLGLSPLKEGRYALSFSAEGKHFCLPLESGAPILVHDAPSIKEGFSVLLCYLRTDAEPIAYGHCGVSNVPADVLLAATQQGDTQRRRKIPVPLSPFETPAPVSPNVPTAPGVPVPDSTVPEEEDAPKAHSFRGQSYNDDAIAASDYFRAHADEAASRHGGEEAQDLTGGGDPSAHEAPLFPDGALTYYNSVREKLDEAFARFPKDDGLSKVFPQSEWVKTESGARIGVIYHDGRPRYLCVAVEKKGDAPKELGDKAVFVPKDAFTKDEGYYVVFQDADTGEMVTVSNS